MAETERSLQTLGVPGRVTGHELEGPMRLHGKDRALVPARKRMRVPVWLRRVEEKHVVGVREECLPLPGPAEDPLANEDDAVRRVWLLGAFRLDRGAAAEVHDRDPQRFEQGPSRVRHGALCGCGATHGSTVYEEGQLAVPTAPRSSRNNLQAPRG